MRLRESFLIFFIGGFFGFTPNNMTPIFSLILFSPKQGHQYPLWTNSDSGRAAMRLC